MKALVLLGGLGTRLRPVTYSVPKQLIPIAGKPMLYHVLDLLPPTVEEAVLATGYKADEIARYVTEHPPPIPVRTVVEAEPLGTGGGMRNARSGMSDPFLLLNSDVIAGFDVASLLAQHAAHSGLGTMTLVEVDDPTPYGVAELDPEDRIRRFVEKPTPEEAPSHWINAGLGVWQRDVLDRIPDRTPLNWEREVLPTLLADGVYAYRATGFWEDAGTPERLLRAQRYLFDAGRGGRRSIPKGTTGKGPVAIDPSAIVEGATFGGSVTVSPRAVVGAGAYLEDAVVMDGASIAPGASVVHSIIGPHAHVRTGHRVSHQVLGEAAEA
ncbi:MAG: NDP-sugar synthase [Thermoplasmata archaeon]|nr:NDP-sugar synthase [Thermoplasmata archaeon]